MIFPKLQMTDAGRALLTKVVADSEELHFTKLGLGSGSTAGTSAMTNLVSSITITSLTKGTGAASMTGVLDNANLQTGYNATELGVYAQDPDDGEILYAYAFNGTNPTYIPAASSGSYERINLTVVVAIGDAEEVTATIGEFTGYASLEDFNAHVADTSNPHAVTAAQVGLGNVPNVSTDNQTPTFTEASTLANIASGETLKVILGKIKKAITSLTSHLSASNPHGITPGGISAYDMTFPTATTVTDFDLLTTPGCYLVSGGNLQHAPHFGSTFRVDVTGLQHSTTSSGEVTIVRQMTTEPSSGKVYSREYMRWVISGNEVAQWTAWEYMWDSSASAIYESAGYYSYKIPSLLPGVLDDSTHVSFIVTTAKSLEKISGVEVNGNITCWLYGVAGRLDSDNSYGNTYSSATAVKEDDNHIKITITGSFSGTVKTPVMIEFKYTPELRFTAS